MTDEGANGIMEEIFTLQEQEVGLKRRKKY